MAANNVSVISPHAKRQLQSWSLSRATRFLVRRVGIDSGPSPAFVASALGFNQAESQLSSSFRVIGNEHRRYLPYFCFCAVLHATNGGSNGPPKHVEFKFFSVVLLSTVDLGSLLSPRVHDPDVVRVWSYTGVTCIHHTFGSPLRTWLILRTHMLSTEEVLAI